MYFLEQRSIFIILRLIIERELNFFEKEEVHYILPLMFLEHWLSVETSICS